jgi:DedD protein
MSEVQDTEITLGTGRLLSLFFGLVIVCAVFFGLGFALGKTAGPVAAAPIIQGPAAALPVQTSAKPSSAKAAYAASNDAKPSTSDELAFYKTPEQKSAAVAEPEPEPEAASETPARVAHTTPAPQPVKTASAMGQGFVVQIAAVTKKDDAEALVGALRKKTYPVFVLADNSDRLFHVQVGPFSDRKDAQIVKDRLAGDGYNAIVK